MQPLPPPQTINRDFLIRVYPARKGNNSLLSFTLLETIIGEELATKYVQRAYAKGVDKLTCRPRREEIIKIEFASK